MATTNTVTAMVAKLKAALQKQSTAPQVHDFGFFNALSALPNPDPILRNIGQADLVYTSIMADAHVSGEIRSIRGEFRRMKYRVLAASDDSRAIAAKELCIEWMARYQPNKTADWQEVMWQMMSAIFTGYKIHYLDWRPDSGMGRVWLPARIMDFPNRRFHFDGEANLFIRSQSNPAGAIADDNQFIVSRHAGSLVNPYGQSLLSSCFWPWTFKTGGWRLFSQYCERYGLPWPIARYPRGTQDDDINLLGDAIRAMISHGYAVVEEGTAVDIIETKSTGGGLPQESMIDRANREMSKALTGQSQNAELHTVGARSSGEVAQKRQSSINDSDRDIAAASFNRIFALITLFNFGPDIAAPILDFYSDEKEGKDRAEVYRFAVEIGAAPSKHAFLQEMGIPQAQNEADTLALSPTKPTLKNHNLAFSKAENTGDLPLGMDARVALAIEAADFLIERDVIDPFKQALDAAIEAGRPIDQFLQEFSKTAGGIELSALRDLTAQALLWSSADGAAGNTKK